MPTFYKIDGYYIYIWMNENNEPVHFHVSKGKPTPNSTKFWILSDGSVKLASNRSRVPKKTLNKVAYLMSNNYDFINFWLSAQGYIKYIDK